MMDNSYFCTESITGVYLGQPKDELTYGGELFLDCYQKDITLYLTKGYRYLLETEHYGISIECGGVFLLNKLGDAESFEKADEWLDNYYHEDDSEDTPWICHEHTLFVGEKLKCVEKAEGGYLLTFDDFSLKVVPINEDNTDGLREKLWDRKNHRMYGFERYLNQKCTCGGQGIVFLDFVDDYFIECEKCGRSIMYSQMILQDAIDEWNYIQSGKQ